MADNTKAKNSLFNLYCELVVARKKHQEQNNVVTKEPTAEDFQDYVVHYAHSVKEGTI